MKNTKKMDYTFLNSKEVADAVSKFSKYWGDLSSDQKHLAKNMTILVEFVGGRSEAAELFQVAKSTIDNFRSGKTDPKFLDLVNMANVAGVDLEFLLMGSGFELVRTRKFNNEEDNLPRVQEIIRYEVSASAGSGMLVLSEASDRHLHISRNWIKKIIKPGSKLGVIDVVGDSMWPTLLDGDLVVVDFNYSKHELTGGGLFVFSNGEDVFVKRVVLLPDGSLEIISDNDKYQKQTLTSQADLDAINIHGKVVWVGGSPRPYLGKPSSK